MQEAQKTEEKRDPQEILAEEELQRKCGALIHNLTKSADKWGRIAVAGITRDITSRVKLFSTNENREIDKIQRSRIDKKKDAHKEAKKRMALIQFLLTESLTAIDAECDESAANVRGSFKPQYVFAEHQLHERTDAVTSTVACFIDALDDYVIEKLESLTKKDIAAVILEFANATTGVDLTATEEKAD